MEKRKNRSDNYQWVILETVCSNEMMESFSNNDSIYNRLNPFAHDDELVELEEELREEFWRIVDEALTPRQKEVIKLCADGYTQMEIAKMLNVNQSSITKSIHGNVDYKNGRRCYGGTERKLQKIISQDEKIQAILERMRELREEKW